MKNWHLAGGWATPQVPNFEQVSDNRLSLEQAVEMGLSLSWLVKNKQQTFKSYKPGAVQNSSPSHRLVVS